MVNGTAKTQARQALENLAIAAEAAGGDVRNTTRAGADARDGGGRCEPGEA
jgi:enamine deaminase RidA (YjgF/YER057c/UK114 family)